MSLHPSGFKHNSFMRDDAIEAAIVDATLISVRY